MTELIWDGKYKDGKRVGPLRIALPFQTVETAVPQRAQRLGALACERPRRRLVRA